MPDFELENKCNGVVCGIDEAGRGPWAGPVVAGAVVIKDKNLHPELLKYLNDSKKLSAQRREKLYNLLFEEEKLGKVSVGIGPVGKKLMKKIFLMRLFWQWNVLVQILISFPIWLWLMVIKNQGILTALLKPWLRVMQSLIQLRRLQSWLKYIGIN